MELVARIKYQINQEPIQSLTHHIPYKLKFVSVSDQSRTNTIINPTLYPGGITREAYQINQEPIQSLTNSSRLE